jgi:SAM-dependent methyltransferase
VPETDSQGVNAAQEVYWNSAVGERWALHQETLDGMHARVGERLIARARPRAGERVLDIGCGAGDTCLALAPKVGAAGRIVGIDISRVLLERAAERVRKAGALQVELLPADAQTHRFPSASFDLLVSRFGVMFFADPVAAVGNLRAALRPGGRLHFAAWASADANPWFTLPRDAASSVLGEAPPTPPRAPGPTAFAETGYVLDILQAAGYRDRSADAEEVTLEFPGDLSALTRLATVVGPAARLLRTFEATADQAAEVSRRIDDALRGFAVDEGVRIPARINFFAAVA